VANKVIALKIFSPVAMLAPRGMLGNSSQENMAAEKSAKRLGSVAPHRRRKRVILMSLFRLAKSQWPQSFRHLVMVVFLIAALAPTAWGQKKDSVQKVLVGTTGIQMAIFPLMIAKAEGYYRDEGLDLDLVVMRPDLAIKSVVTGDVSFSAPFTNAVRAAMSGYPIRILMALMTGTDHSLVVKPSIRKVEDLKGKTLAVSAPGATPDVSTRIVLKKFGLVPDVDTQILFLSGGSTLRFAALEGGSVDGALLSAPYNKMLVRKGFRELVYMKDLINIPFNGLAANTNMMRDNPDLITKTLRATLKGIHYIKTHKAECLEIMAQKFNLKDREIASLVYDGTVPLFPSTGIPSEASMKETIESGRATQKIARPVSISEIADWSFAKRAYNNLQLGNK
jgi:NitT/TauT family transport system substrate-binding protein